MVAVTNSAKRMALKNIVGRIVPTETINLLFVEGRVSRRSRFHRDLISCVHILHVRFELSSYNSHRIQCGTEHVIIADEVEFVDGTFPQLAIGFV